MMRKAQNFVSNSLNNLAMRAVSRHIIFGVCLISSALSYCQGMAANDFNFYTFPQNTNDVSPELKKLVPQSFYSHPEFGVLPHNAPCDSCYELIHLRTDTTRMFVEKGSEGTQFYSQAAYGAIHRKDNQNRYLTNDHRLKQSAIDLGIYEAKNQIVGVEINTNEQNSKLYLEDGSVMTFNNHLTLLNQTNSGQLIDLGSANWSNYHAGEDGVVVVDAWPGIDIQMQVRLGEIKTNYIIKSNLNIPDGFLIFKDDLDFPAGFDVDINELFQFEPLSGKKIGEVTILNDSGLGIHIGSAIGYDHSEDRTHMTSFGYSIENDDLEIWVPVTWLNDSSMVYPLVVDPLVTSTATFTAGIIRYLYLGSFCAGAGDCVNTLNVPLPANATLTGATASLVQQTLGAGFCGGTCWMSDAGYYFSGPCGVNGYWGCNFAGIGTCTMTNGDISNTVSCLVPVCTGSVNISVLTSYCYCATGGACGVSCQRINNNTWTVTITGHTVGTLGDVATGNGSQTINDPTCAGTSILNPTPANGVPGYTYLWSTGATTPTINVINTTAVITCTVTDACGVSVVATFNIGCPLPIRLNYFEAELENEKVKLEWETLSEINSDYFVVQRADKSGNFSDLFKVDANENSSKAILYSIVDDSALSGLSYYRLKMVDMDGAVEFSDVKNILINTLETTLYIVPNPSNGLVELIYSAETSGEVRIEIYTAGGEILKSENVQIETGNQLISQDYRDLPKGVYILKFYTKEKVITEKLVID